MQHCEVGEWLGSSSAAQTAMDGNSCQAGQSHRSPLVEGTGGTPAPTNQHDREADLDYSCAYPLRPHALSLKQIRCCPETGAFRNEPAVCTSRFGVVTTRRVSA